MLPSHTLRTQQSLMNFRRDFAASYNITHKRASWVRFFETDNTYSAELFEYYWNKPKASSSFVYVCVATLRHIRFTLIIPNTHMHSYIRNSAFIIKQALVFETSRVFQRLTVFVLFVKTAFVPCTYTCITEGRRRLIIMHATHSRTDSFVYAIDDQDNDDSTSCLTVFFSWYFCWCSARFHTYTSSYGNVYSALYFFIYTFPSDKRDHCRCSLVDFIFCWRIVSHQRKTFARLPLYAVSLW